MVNLNDDEAFVGPQSPEKALELLDLAEKAGLPAHVVRTAPGGFIVPADLLPEGEPVEDDEEVESEEEPENAKPDSTWHIPEILQYAEDHQIQIPSGTTKKADILAVIAEKETDQ